MKFTEANLSMHHDIAMTMAEVASGDALMVDENQRAQLLDRLNGYSVFDAEAVHLRPHQVDAVEAFRQKSLDILSGHAPASGMSIVHPTGSGKSIVGAELFRMSCIGSEGSSDGHLKSLWLTPRVAIGRQIARSDQGKGVIGEYVPGATVSEYMGAASKIGADMTVMTYQSLVGAVRNGVIDAINPTLIICDEAHHVIDGAWSRAVKAVSAGKLLVGLTATPEYSGTKTISGLFAHELVRKTMRSGIEEGILSPLKGRIYQASSRIIIRRHIAGGDFSDEDLFNAIADSEDNYLVAKICAEEVSQGRRGIVNCVPGHDRAHAKVMAKILSNVDVTQNGMTRKMRAEYVDGSMSKEELQARLLKHRQGTIDVLTHVDLLTEGWDSPETDFMVTMRPTTSALLATQRLGRILRPRKDKVATLHELSYQVSDPDMIQVLYMDVVNGTAVDMQRSLSKYHPDKRALPPLYPLPSFEVQDFGLEADELRTKLESVEATTMASSEVTVQGERIPYDWLTTALIARKLCVSPEEAEAAIQSVDVRGKSQEIRGVAIEFFPPDCIVPLTAHFGIAPLSDDRITLHELTLFHMQNAREAVQVTPRAVKMGLIANDIAPQLNVDGNGAVVQTFPRSAKDIPLDFGDPLYRVSTAEPTAEINAKRPVTDGEVYNWLVEILVNPHDNTSELGDHIIANAQKQLVDAMRAHSYAPASSFAQLEARLTQGGYIPTEQMLRVMEHRHISFSQLMSAAGMVLTRHVRQGKIKLS